MFSSSANTAFLASLFIVALLVTRALSNKSEFTYTLDDGYPLRHKTFGNIAGVDVDKEGNVIIFHRGSHHWVEGTFGLIDNIYKLDRNSPIKENTVVTIDPKTKNIVREWGSELFFMPHGLSLDLEAKNLWLTDVALHQVFKYSLDGKRKLIELGTPFVPGNSEDHFCKPTSVADTGEFVFVADGYCNSRVVMFSATGKFISEFGQSIDTSYLETQPNQPVFNIPHKITYANDAKMLCVADRENGRIQCFSFEPKRSDNGEQSSEPGEGVLLNGAIKLKFVIQDPLFNGRLFSLDYSPLRGGIIVAVSGETFTEPKKVPLGFVYNVTTGQLLSRFSPPNGMTFGMAHDLAITGAEAESLYVVDITPINLWRFSRPTNHHDAILPSTIVDRVGLNRAIALASKMEPRTSFISYLVVFTMIGAILYLVSRAKRNIRHTNTSIPFSFYSSGYPTSLNSLFGDNGRFPRRANGSGSHVKSNSKFFSTLFSRRAFLNLLENDRQHHNEFSRIPLEESENSDNDKSDSDIEEFNINQATRPDAVKITV